MIFAINYLVGWSSVQHVVVCEAKTAAEAELKIRDYLFVQKKYCTASMQMGVRHATADDVKNGEAA